MEIHTCTGKRRRRSREKDFDVQIHGRADNGGGDDCGDDEIDGDETGLDEERTRFYFFGRRDSTMKCRNISAAKWRKCQEAGVKSNRL
mmetsp:Transcript_35346/g.47731  ORF Transcript_35346/g.47731 Transcript_35346/m.47731 type:complete len:88 (+) Transcript_35346:90-353(+)